jgi:hypothetical protein
MTCVLSCNSSTPQVAPKREKLLAAQGKLSVTMSQLSQHDLCSFLQFFHTAGGA